MQTSECLVWLTTFVSHGWLVSLWIWRGLNPKIVWWSSQLTTRWGDLTGSFAQWRYSNQWSNREVLLLLVENYTQYPANSTWNTVVYGNFWRLPRKQIIVSVSSFPDHAPGKVQAAPPSRPCPRKRRKARNSIPPGGPRCRDFSWWLVGWCEISHPDWPNK